MSQSPNESSKAAPRIPIPRNPMPRKKGAVAVIQDNAARLLVIRRSQTVAAPGKFCLPGGGIEMGESEAEAMVREMQEELNVEVEPMHKLWQSLTSWNVELHWWAAKLPSPDLIKANPEEVESFHWFSLKEMRELSELLESAHHFLDAIESGEIKL